jgi:SPP1 gp7 family putative phage head morphogenesis protein
MQVLAPAVPSLVGRAPRGRADSMQPPHKRIGIAGGPRTGKTTLAGELAQRLGLSVTHSDDLISLGWSSSSDELARRMLEASSGIFEGVAIVRGLRKALARSSDKPLDALLVLRQPRERLTDAQARMSRAHETILREIVPQLRARGVLLASSLYELEPDAVGLVRIDAPGDDEDPEAELETLTARAREAVKRRVQTVAGIVTPGVARRVIAHTKAETEAQLGTVLGIDVFSPESGMAEVAQKFQTAQLAAVEGLVDKQLAAAKDIIAQGLRDGWRPETITQALRQNTDASKARATILANDAVGKLHGTLTMERQIALGIKRYTWSTAHDEKVRPGHRALEGSEQKWAKPPIVNPSSGKRAHPGFDTHYYPCRCVAIPILDDVLASAGIDIGDLPPPELGTPDEWIPPPMEPKPRAPARRKRGARAL